jgi:NADPH2:quinone reductase
VDSTTILADVVGTAWHGYTSPATQLPSFDAQRQMKTHAIRIRKHGGPDVLEYVEVELPEPAPGEARIRHTAIGLNFIDTYHRTGLYPTELPAGLGSEAAGVVEAVGPGVELMPGERVAYTGRPADAYSQRRNFPAARLVPLPDQISDESAAACFLKGMTAWYLLHRSYAVKAGDPILLYAAAGGVGLIVGQWAKHLGATVIGVVSTDEKAELARASGCDHVIMANDSDLPGKVRSLTDGAGVAAVYDSVGRDTFYASLDSLRPHGVMVSFGNASGPVEPFAPAELAKRHSLYVTRPTLFDFIDTRERLLEGANALFDVMKSGKISVNQHYALKDAAQAHRDLEARKTTGSTVLIP